MNHSASSSASPTNPPPTTSAAKRDDALGRLKRDLLNAEVRLAKARAAAAGAEVDIKVLGAQLRALVK